MKLNLEMAYMKMSKEDLLETLIAYGDLKADRGLTGDERLGFAAAAKAYAKRYPAINV
mgnify:CR=1 FL=1|jgi:hypothetical protein|tara:strand:+ start:4799 stop:4972 length:174 start_codon:yes stop_codon:yes gene_type:complete